MKKFLVLLSVFSLMSCVISPSSSSNRNTRGGGIYGNNHQNRQQVDTSQLLPENFPVYVKGNTVINHPVNGFEKRILPTVNHYKGRDGGYVAIYSRNRNNAVYSVGGGIYVLGQIRVKGNYVGRVFHPQGYSKGANITRDTRILGLCRQYFPQFSNQDIWIGGDTAGWFGVR